MRDNALVLDKWFSTQALSIARRHAGGRSPALARHPDFTLANPNRLRALVGAFGANQRAFHAADGRGLSLPRRQLIALDKLNPQTAARLVPPLGRWRRFDAGARGADARRAGADRRDAGAVEGRVRAGVEKPGVEGSLQHPVMPNAFQLKVERIAYAETAKPLHNTRCTPAEAGAQSGRPL